MIDLAQEPRCPHYNMSPMGSKLSAFNSSVTSLEQDGEEKGKENTTQFEAHKVS